jgi:hypothetical protein
MLRTENQAFEVAVMVAGPKRARKLHAGAGDVQPGRRAPSSEAVTGGYGGGRLATAFRDAEGRVSVGLAAEHFGMSKLQFAEAIGLNRDTVYRAKRLLAPKAQVRAKEMLEIIGRIAAWAGGEKQALAWYRAEPIPAFGGRTAESLVKDGKATAVRDYLDHVATGGFA